MFADSAKIIIKSGKGGNGHVSFRRENMFRMAARTVAMVEKVAISSLK